MQLARDYSAASFAKRAQLTGLMLLGCVSLAWAADKVAPKLIEAGGDDFLEYLGSLESDDETWMDFSAAAPVHDASKSGSAAKDSKTAASASSSSAASVTTKAASTATGKADK